jgi:preprotein translocase subunit SecB
MSTERLKLYPIQATNISLRELRIKTHVPPNRSLQYDEAEFNLDMGHGDYDPETKQIQISARVQVGEENAQFEEDGTVKGNPFFLSVELVGFFSVISEFPIDRIYEWATTNATYILYPFMREHVFALTARAGFTPMIMPIVEVPLFRMEKEAESQTESPIAVAQPEIEAPVEKR